LNGSFTWQKLYVGVAYQSFKTQYSTGAMGLGTIVNLNSPAVSGGQNTLATGKLFDAAQISDKQTLAGATYDFGILKAYAQWVGRKVQNDYVTSATVGAGEQMNRNAQQIGVRSYITPTIESWASIGNGKVKATQGNATVNFVGWQLGTNYYLSKRTNLYAIYGQNNASSANTNGVAATGSNTGANQYALGLRHTF
jgi:predicted porin